MSGSSVEPTRTRGYKKKERTRRTLIVAAVEEIAINGEAFTILDVTRRAGVSNGTFYNYFADRDALADAVVTEVVASFVDTSADLVGLDDPVRRFATITALLLEHSAANPQLATVLLRLQAIAQPDSSTVDPFRHLRADLQEAFERGQLTKEPTDAAVDLIIGTLFRAVLRLTTERVAPGYNQELIRLLLETFGLAQDAAATVASDAIEAAPEFDHATLVTDSIER